MAAPIILFVFARPEHTRLTLGALAANTLATDSDLIIYSDAARHSDKEARVAEVRAIVRDVSGFNSVTVIERETNLGLANNIIDGVTTVCNQFGRVIVLEDDMVTSPHFLTYMNEALDTYEGNEEVVSIHGYTYPVSQSLPEAFFLRGADCWGWATWSHGWACFNPDGQFLLDELKRRKLLAAFDFNGAYPYSKMLKGQIIGANDSWAIRWYASAFLAEKLTLYPGRNLVQNIGNDASGTHCDKTTIHDADLSSTPIDLTNVDVIPSSMGRQSFEDFFRQTQAGWREKIMRRILMIFG